MLREKEQRYLERAQQTTTVSRASQAKADLPSGQGPGVLHTRGLDSPWFARGELQDHISREGPWSLQVEGFFGWLGGKAHMRWRRECSPSPPANTIITHSNLCFLFVTSRNLCPCTKKALPRKCNI